MLSSSVKLAQEVAAQDILESGDDSGKEQSPDRDGFKKKGKGLKATKIGKKKVVKKTVFRNNFVKESDSQQ